MSLQKLLDFFKKSMEILQDFQPSIGMVVCFTLAVVFLALWVVNNAVNKL